MWVSLIRGLTGRAGRLRWIEGGIPGGGDSKKGILMSSSAGRTGRNDVPAVSVQTASKALVTNGIDNKKK